MIWHQLYQYHPIFVRYRHEEMTYDMIVEARRKGVGGTGQLRLLTSNGSRSLRLLVLRTAYFSSHVHGRLATTFRLMRFKLPHQTLSRPYLVSTISREQGHGLRATHQFL